MSPVDVALLLFVLLFAVSGYRQGFMVGAMSLAGFFGGALIGLQLGPLVAQQFASSGTRLIVSLIAIFGLAVLGQALAGWLGHHLHHAIKTRGGRTLNDIGGAVISVFAVLVFAWLIAVPLGSTSLPWLNSWVRNSALIHGVDQVMPEGARALSEALHDTVDTSGFPDFFGDLTPTRVRDVPAPDPALANSQAVRTARRSVVKVLGAAPRCSRRIEGSGFVYAPQRVMTNAHVVAGTNDVVVELLGDRYDARVVLYDPKRDLAVLYAPGLDAPALPFARQEASSGAGAVVIGFPLDGPFDAQAARVSDLRRRPGQDIYESAQVVREIYTIRALVRSGNSGGPLVDTNGRVIGVIFAAAADDQNTGFAISAAEAASDAAAGDDLTRGVRTGNCA